MAENEAPKIPTGGEAGFSKGGVQVAIVGWSGGEDGTRVNVSTTKNHSKARKKTYTEQKGTQVIYRATVNAFCDSDEALLPSLRVNEEIEDVVLTAGEDNVEVRMARAIVESAPIESGGVAGVSSYRFTIASQGEYDIDYNGTATDAAPAP